MSMAGDLYIYLTIFQTNKIKAELICSGLFVTE